MRIIPHDDAEYTKKGIKTIFYIELEKLAGKWYFFPASYANAFLVYLVDSVLTACPITTNIRPDLRDRIEKDTELEALCLEALRGAIKHDWIIITWGVNDRPFAVNKYHFTTDLPYGIAGNSPCVFYNAVDDTFYKFVTTEANSPYIYMMANQMDFPVPQSGRYSAIGKLIIKTYLNLAGIKGEFSLGQKLEGVNTQLLKLDSSVFFELEKVSKVVRTNALRKALKGSVDADKSGLEEEEVPKVENLSIPLSHFLLTSGNDMSVVLKQAETEGIRVIIELDEGVPEIFNNRILNVLVDGTFVKFIVSNLNVRLAELKAYFDLHGLSVAVSDKNEEE